MLGADLPRGGFELALCCDLIVASETARFSEIFARRGMSLDFGGSWLLPRLVGLHKAKELALLADVIPAAEAAASLLGGRAVETDEAQRRAAILAGGTS